VADNNQPRGRQQSTKWQTTISQVTDNNQPRGRQQSAKWQTTISQEADNNQPSGRQQSAKWQTTINQVADNNQPSGSQKTAKRRGMNHFRDELQPALAANRPPLEFVRGIVNLAYHSWDAVMDLPCDDQDHLSTKMAKKCEGLR